ncbi:YdcF family protein [Macrococcus carouselicus]|uniref:YdcF family protein n=1 Tax=Macrococcus carouselicus TaxID=69969 RepID=A0A9Q8FPK0_9STAP|nr:YdcF family protein [Macrococcus carouselicus]TDM02208.1 YdcF family protein [Macrococcus carouselicus]
MRNNYLSEFIFIEHIPEPADIILIPGSTEIALAKKALELYRKRYADCILISGGYNKKLAYKQTEAGFLAEYLYENGISPSAIYLDHFAQNTQQNAEFSKNICNKNNLGIKKVIIICKNYHAKRFILSYQRYFCNDCKFIIIPVVDSRNISKSTWESTDKGKALVYSEIEKIKKYFNQYPNC